MNELLLLGIGGGLVYLSTRNTTNSTISMIGQQFNKSKSVNLGGTPQTKYNRRPIDTTILTGSQMGLLGKNDILNMNLGGNPRPRAPLTKLERAYAYLPHRLGIPLGLSEENLKNALQNKLQQGGFDPSLIPNIKDALRVLV